jgi:hypothetical protein
VTRAEIERARTFAFDVAIATRNAARRDGRALTADERITIQTMTARASFYSGLLVDADMRVVLQRPDTVPPRPRVQPAGAPVPAAQWRSLPLIEWNRLVASAFRIGALATVATLEGRSLDHEATRIDVRRRRAGTLIPFCIIGDDANTRSARAWFAASAAPGIAGLPDAIRAVSDQDRRHGEDVLREDGRVHGWDRERRDAEMAARNYWLSVCAIVEPMLSGISLPGPEAVYRATRALDFDTRQRLRRERPDGWLVP